ncbi:tetratricopeptide repeat protein [Candidatus Woesearchaeota archaeon]|jgi:hypothetical protein|nr:tetratricopeptide repeat protein [Candidatus Woesearchaeota archaeon]MBT4150425.1 tetratricopeptide repeat protein [Candidatus Woesearchaeota archaeon]MBT4247500.1 tetratricopeptide repeat protein [Candidatus Woesearchaeota archaeon]MBT4434461.1 tetratricopeptide repeat protein [Candidatus Woesearchaeota archaeon]MBT7331685.1 tetratricopeptide repeat protein [Candidatus Woesearchaeota archaeon]
MNKIQSLAATVALLFNVGCMTPLERYTHEVGHKPETIEELKSYGRWSEGQGEYHEAISAYKGILQRSNDNNDIARLDLGRAYITCLKGIRRQIRGSFPIRSRPSLIYEGTKVCMEAEEFIKTLPDTKELYPFGENIRYHCDHIKNP